MLKRLNDEVLERGANACLPSQLTDEWLEVLSASADNMLGNETHHGDTVTGAVCMAVILRILDAQGRMTEAETNVPLTEMHDYFVHYRIELALEEIYRKTGRAYGPTTIETILMPRDKFSG